jgi:hypothetical protein
MKPPKNNTGEVAQYVNIFTYKRKAAMKVKKSIPHFQEFGPQEPFRPSVYFLGHSLCADQMMLS